MASRAFRGLGPHGFHRIVYDEWGDPANPRVVICVHGLTRSARDFDALAEALSRDRRVLVPDMPGRARSDRLPAPEDYAYPQYAADMAALIARSGAEEVDWVGTSMGGIIGMSIAAQPNAPVRRLVLNDIGPVVAKEGLARIATYAGTDPSFADLDGAVEALWPGSLPFGPMTDAERRRFIEHQLRRRPDGSWGLHYDPAIAWQVKDADPQDVVLWDLAWDTIRAPVLVLRGAESDLLRAETVAEMARRGPGCRAIEIPGVGHTPALTDARQIDAIRDFLLA